MRSCTDIAIALLPSRPWLKKRFFRNAMIGFPHRVQNEYVGQPSATTTSAFSFLVSFLQLSHFLTSTGGKRLVLMPMRSPALRGGPRASPVGLCAGGVARHRWYSPAGAPRLLS